MITQNIKKEYSISFEDVIYDFLNIIADSKYKDKFAVKGAIALQELTKQKQYNDIVRTTTDLDLDLKSKSKSDWKDFVYNIETIASKLSKLGLTYKIVYRRGLKKGGNVDNLGFTVSKNDLNYLNFNIDVNISNNTTKFRKLQLEKNNIDMYTSGYMIADKMKVIATENVYRRMKDLIDLYILSQLENYDYIKLYNIIHEKLRNVSITSFYFLTDCDKDVLLHAYTKLKRVNNKPTLEEVITRVATFTIPLYVCNKRVQKWNKTTGEWTYSDFSNALYTFVRNSIICRESAGYRLGLTTDYPTPIRIYNNGVVIKSQFIEIYRNEFDMKDIEITEDGLKITNSERTICELIKYDCQEESILRAIDTYLFMDNKPPEVLLVKSIEYGVFDEMKKHIDYVMENDIYDES